MTREGVRERVRAITLWALAIFYAAAGFAHLNAPDPFVAIVPSWVPGPRLVVFFTGLCEFAGALGLLLRPLRPLAGAMLALYAVCVFPANIFHAIYDVRAPGLPSGLAYHIPRLLLQPVIVWLPLFAAGLIDWPLFRNISR